MKSNKNINVCMDDNTDGLLNSDGWKQMLRAALVEKGQSLRVYYRKGLWKYTPGWIFALFTSFHKLDITYTKTGPVYIDILSGELVKE